MSGESPHPFEIHLAAVCAVGLLGIAIYFNTLEAPFVYDDTHNIQTNVSIRVTDLDLQSLRRAAFDSPLNRPVAYLSFALNHYLWGYDVSGFHVVNIFIHFLNGVLVYFLALLTLQRLAGHRDPTEPQLPDSSIRWIALFTALLFTAHPVQTNAVTYIVQRMTSLATMFYLLSLLLFVLGRLARRSWRRWTLWFGSATSWALALGSKEIAATLPFAVLLYEWYFFRDLSREWLRRNIAYLLVLAGLSLAFVLLHLIGPFATYHYPYLGFTMWERVMTQFRVVIFYVGLLLFPHPSRLNLTHTFPKSVSLFEPLTTVLCLALIVAALGLAVLIADRRRLASFCIVWFFLQLAIESSVFPLEMAYEHRLYLPLFGFSLGLITLVFTALGRQRSWAVAASLVVVLLLGTATHLRNRTWRDNITLWSDVLAKNPNDKRAHYSLGVALAQKDELEEATAHFREALRLDPDLPDAHSRLGIALALQRRFDEAIEQLSEELRIDPDSAQTHRVLELVRKLRDASTDPPTASAGGDAEAPTAAPDRTLEEISAD